MFFKITSQKLDKFPFNHQLNETHWLNCDAGWTDVETKYGVAYIKGYCHERAFDVDFAEELFEDTEPRFTGNFLAVLARSSGAIDITNDSTRATRLWRDATSVGNIDITDGINVWATNTVTITATEMVERNWDNITPHNVPACNFNDALDQIDNILTEKFTWLKDNGKNIKIFYTGGIDTLLCISYLRKLGIQHELVTSEHYDYDKFTCNFDKDIKNHWGYRQMHHWCEPTYLVSGACGDEFFLRGPATANLILSHFGINILQLLTPKHYHYHSFRDQEKLDIYTQQRHDPEIQKMLSNKKEVSDYIVGMCMNDHQHWHLGNTLTFTPFKDTRILAILLEMEKNEIVQSILDARIQRELIGRNNPELLQYLDQYKNQGRSGMLQMIEYHLT
jgi:hypothetical protein